MALVRIRRRAAQIKALEKEDLTAGLDAFQPVLLDAAGLKRSFLSSLLLSSLELNDTQVCEP